jgi:hypothetical protein
VDYGTTVLVLVLVRTTSTSSLVLVKGALLQVLLEY